MAADTRPFKSKEQDGHGNEVIVRDQQLVEQTSQTTMASGEYFEIVDVDGRMAKIPKDNMIGVVREALGTLLNGLADQTTVTKALTLNGDTLGASTAATLASVLGVINKPISLHPNFALKIITSDTYFTEIYGVAWQGGHWFRLSFEGYASTNYIYPISKNPANTYIKVYRKPDTRELYVHNTSILVYTVGIFDLVSSNSSASIVAFDSTDLVEVTFP